MKKINVLIVDDDTINLKLLSIMLGKNNLVKDIKEANNGLVALDVLNKKFDIDLIFLDIVMPMMNGIEFLINVQANESLSKIPIIVLTTDETMKVESLEKGAYDFLTKPIREAELFEKIQTISKMLP